MSRDAWMDQAACRRIPDLPWTAEPKTAPAVLFDLMADVCAACPVLDACEAFVAEEKITGGYWAGAHRTYPPVPQHAVVPAWAVWVQGTLPLDGAA